VSLEVLEARRCSSATSGSDGAAERIHPAAEECASHFGGGQLATPNHAIINQN